MERGCRYHRIERIFAVQPFSGRPPSRAGNRRKFIADNAETHHQGKRGYRRCGAEKSERYVATGSHVSLDSNNQRGKTGSQQRGTDNETEDCPFGFVFSIDASPCGNAHRIVVETGDSRRNATGKTTGEFHSTENRSETSGEICPANHRRYAFQYSATAGRAPRRKATEIEPATGNLNAGGK